MAKLNLIFVLRLDLETGYREETERPD